jgi:uncharacterized membrane protein
VSALRIGRPGYPVVLVDQGPACGRVSFSRRVAPIGGLLVVAPIDHKKRDRRRFAEAKRVHGSPSERALEVLRIVRKHDGNRAAASRELGVSESAVSRCMRRLAAKGLVA